MGEFVTIEAFKEYSCRMDEINKTQDARLVRLEDTVEKIQSLTISVEKMAVSIDTMAKEISKQGEKLERIEAKPANNWDKLVWIIISAVVGIAVGFLLTSIGIH